MFTGIIEEIGMMKDIKKGAKLSVITIQGSVILEDLHLGDSIAVNGVCLTVISFTNHTFSADMMSETLNRSSLGSLKVESYVNLERAMAANGRFGGHMMSGHIDGTGTIEKIEEDGNAIWFTISATKKVMRYVVEKGSVSIDGISLTVAKVSSDRFSVSTIPHTVKVTTLSKKKVGNIVNLENDIVGKYIEKFMNLEMKEKSQGNITTEFLEKFGY